METIVKTVVTFCSEPTLCSYLEQVASEESLHLIKVPSVQGVLTEEAFVYFIDLSQFQKHISLLIDKLKTGRHTFVVVGVFSNEGWGSSSFSPIFLQRSNVHFIEIISGKKKLIELIRGARKLCANTLRTEQLIDKKLYRILHLHHRLRESSSLDIDDLCQFYHISKRTLRRDLKVIRELFPEINPVLNGNWS